MKKILPLLLAALLLGGCGSQEHTHTPLEGWERDFYRENKSRVELKKRYTAQELEQQQRLNALLDGK